jgi:hypothetical protein
LPGRSSAAADGGVSKTDGLPVPFAFIFNSLRLGILFTPNLLGDFFYDPELPHHRLAQPDEK